MRNSGGIQIGPVIITWFALIVVLALCVGIAITAYRTRKRGISITIPLDIGSNILLFGLIMGRLLYILQPPPSAAEFYTREWYLSHPLDLLAGPIAVWTGGLEPAGAILGGVIGALFVVSRKRFDLWEWADILLPGIMAAAIILPWANMAEGQMLGPATTLPWAVLLDNESVHPTPIYVSLWAAISFAIATFIRRRRGQRWQAGVWAIIAGLIFIPGLFLADLLRVDASRPFLGLSTSQITCLVAEIGLAALLLRRTKPESESETLAGNFTEN